MRLVFLTVLFLQPEHATWCPPPDHRRPTSPPLDQQEGLVKCSRRRHRDRVLLSILIHQPILSNADLFFLALEYGWNRSLLYWETYRPASRARFMALTCLQPCSLRIMVVLSTQLTM